MNNRRNLVIVLGAAALLPGTMFAQAKKPVLIGWLSVGSRQSGMRAFVALKQGLAALGWKDGLQIGIEERWAEGQHDRLASLTQDLAAKKPTLIVASSLRAAIQAAKTAPTIPIVMVSSADPVAAGLVTSLARPGGMVTGLSGSSLISPESYSNCYSRQPRNLSASDSWLIPVTRTFPR